MATALEVLLERSEKLEESIYRIVHPERYSLLEESARFVLALAACEVAIEHGRALRFLLRAGLSTSGVSLMRSQGESVVRAMWLFYAASEMQVEKLAAPLNRETEKVANKLPMLAEMISAMEGKAPASAVGMVASFKEMQASALNSFVHGGIHPLQRQLAGYPDPLLEQIVSTSNALVTMAGMVMSLLSGDPNRIAPMSKIQREFADCLPPLLEP